MRATPTKDKLKLSGVPKDLLNLLEVKSDGLFNLTDLFLDIFPSNRVSYNRSKHLLTFRLFKGETPPRPPASSLSNILWDPVAKTITEVPPTYSPDSLYGRQVYLFSGGSQSKC